jgi:hypothetical protein
MKGYEEMRIARIFAGLIMMLVGLLVLLLGLPFAVVTRITKLISEKCIEFASELKTEVSEE